MEVRKDAVHAAPRMLPSLARLFAPHWRSVCWMLAVGALAACVPMVTAAINRAVVDQFADPGAVWRLASVWSLLVLGAAVLSGASSWVSFRVGRAIAARLTRAVFERLLQQSLRYHERNGVAEAQLLLNRCVQQVGGGFTTGFAWVIAAAIQGIGALVAMALMNARWALVAVAVVTLALFLYGVLYARQQKVVSELIELDKQTLEINSQVFDHGRLRVIKRNDLEDRFVGDFASAIDRQEGVMRRRGVGTAAIVQVNIIMPLVAAPLVWLAAPATTGSVGEVVAFALLVPYAFAGIMRILSWHFDLADTWPYLQRALSVLDEPLDNDSTGDSSIRPADLAGQPLILENLRCTLGGTEVLRGVSLVAPPGSYTALVGPNGAGKSTFLDVIARLRGPQTDDTARIGPTTIVRVPRPTLAQHVRAIDSTPVTFIGTARENIVFLKQDASPEKVAWACDVAQIRYSLYRLASTLSSGEKVQMLVAQAVLPDPAVLLIDESLGSLNPTTRRLLRSALPRALPRAVIFETMHEGAVRSRAVTNIVVLDDGVVAEQGTHDQLMRLGGRYAQYVADSES